MGTYDKLEGQRLLKFDFDIGYKAVIVLKM